MESTATTKQRTTSSSESRKRMTSPAVVLGYTREESDKIVAALNKLVANYSVHYQKLRNYHWNVKGSDFFDLHEQFELQYNEAKVHIDEVAERIRVFGRTPYSTMKEYLQHSDIKETGSNIDSELMVEEILEDYNILLSQMMEVVDVTIAKGDAGTEKMVKGFINQIEKHHWMLSAFQGES